MAVVVPAESKSGWEALKLDPKSEVTVLIYKGGKIEANHSGKLDSKRIAQIIKDTDKIVK